MARTGDSFSWENSSLGSTDVTSPTRTFASSGTSKPESAAMVCALCPTIFAFSAPLTMMVFLTFCASAEDRKYAPRSCISFLNFE